MSDIVVREERLLRAPLDWSAAIGGAILCAGISTTLWAFAAGIGFSVTSSAPTWRDSRPLFWVLSGLFLLFNALCSFTVGGYAAGRMRAPTGRPLDEESEFQDGVHGLLAWALAVLLTAMLAVGSFAVASRALAPPAGSAGASTSVAGENIIASELDELFRGARVPAADLEYSRAEAARILLKSSSHDGVSADDESYLTELVSRRTNADRSEAQERVNSALSNSHDELSRARAAAVMQAFLIAVALLVGAAVAWFCAVDGGRDRERGMLPMWQWSSRPLMNRPTQD